MYYYNDKNNELYHYGIKGMRWGVRKHRDSASSQTRAQRKSEKQAYKQKLKADVRMNKKGMIVNDNGKYRNVLTGEEYGRKYIETINKETKVSRLKLGGIVVGAWMTKNLVTNWAYSRRF